MKKAETPSSIYITLSTTTDACPQLLFLSKFTTKQV